VSAVWLCSARVRAFLVILMRVFCGVCVCVQLQCFGYFDASTGAKSKDIIRDPLLGEMDLWEVRESLFLGGRHDVNGRSFCQLMRRSPFESGWR